MKVYALLSGREALLGEAHSKEDVYQLAIKALCCSQPEDRLLACRYTATACPVRLVSGPWARRYQ